MSDLTNVQLPPPSNWQDFERLCQGLWKSIWADPNTQRNGRSGQPQAGVDVYGLPKGESKHAGIQCKGKDSRFGSQLSEQELREEVGKAKNFAPPLGQFILATTANTDVNVQEIARQITIEHLSKGLFTVSVLSWPEIESRLGEHPDVVDTYMPHLGSTARHALKAIVNLEQAQAEIKTETASKSNEILLGINTLNESLKNLIASQNADALDRELTAELDHSRELLEKNQFDIACQLLENIRARVWQTASPGIRFRILTNIGVAKLHLSHKSEAAQYFLDAFDADSSTEKAFSNRVLAFMLRDNLDMAKIAADDGIRAFPQGTLAWARKIQVIGSLNEKFEPTKLPPDLPENDELFLTIGSVLAKQQEFSEAELWLRKAILLSPQSAEIQLTLGDCLALRASKDGRLYSGAPLSIADRQNLEESIQLLEKALEILLHSGKHDQIAQCAQNLSSTFLAITEPSKALEPIEKAIGANARDPELLRRKAHLLLILGRDEEATRTFSELHIDEAKADPLLYAEFQKRAGNPDLALDFIEEHIKSSPISLDTRAAKAAFIEECMKARGSYDDKKRRIIDILKLGLPSLQSELLFAEKAHENHDADTANEFLSRARRSVDQENTSHAWVLLADTLLNLQFRDEAIRIYRQHCSPLNDGPSLRNYLLTLMAADRRREATELLSRIPVQVKRKSFYQRILAGLAYEAGDLQAALAHFEALFELTPKDLSNRVRWAEIQITLHNAQAVESYLVAQQEEEDKLGPDDGVDLARIYSAIGKKLDAVRLVYEGKRKHPNSERANVALMAFLLTDQDVKIPTDQKWPQNFRQPDK